MRGWRWLARSRVVLPLTLLGWHVLLCIRVILLSSQRLWRLGVTWYWLGGMVLLANRLRSYRLLMPWVVLLSNRWSLCLSVILHWLRQMMLLGGILGRLGI